MKDLVFIFILTALSLSCSTKTADPNRPLSPPKGYMNETFMKISYGLGMLELIETEPLIPDEIMEIKNIEYKYIDSLSLQLDL